LLGAAEAGVGGGAVTGGDVRAGLVLEARLGRDFGFAEELCWACDVCFGGADFFGGGGEAVG
jgi:hypothetical protein